MKNNLSIYQRKFTLKETIYGFIAICYHRTKSQNIGNLMTQKYKPGSGDMYGSGFYSTYDLDSQLKKEMADTYGDFVVKTKVSLDRVLILNYAEAKKLYSKRKEFKNEYTLAKQLIVFGIYKSLKEVPEKIKELSKQLSKEKVTSDIALKVLQYSEIKNNINGIVFTGRRDGNVLVLYDINLMYPIAFMFSPKGDETDWVKVKSNKNVKDYMDYKFNYSNNLKSGQSLPSWVSPNRPEEWAIENGEFIWIDGFWENGTWKKGTWKSDNWKKGIWKDGTWGFGLWDDGTWENGTWIDGFWKDGTWIDGFWKDGTWFDGTWKKGTWKKGTWKNGYWDDGTWENGTWENGQWEDGTWEDGFWKEGTWKLGVWKKGTWEDGTWKTGQWQSGQWKDGFWEDGLWEEGTWKLGVWMNGVWENGTWEDGFWKDGTWENGTWKDGTWENGWIYDPNKLGNFDPSWKWNASESHVFSPISPKEYFA